MGEWVLGQGGELGAAGDTETAQGRGSRDSLEDVEFDQELEGEEVGKQGRRGWV